MRRHTRLAASFTLALLLAVSTGSGLAQSTQVGECTLGAESGAAETDGILYSIDGDARSEADLPPVIQQALFDARLQHYQRQVELIDGAILESELERRGKREGKTREALAKELFAVAPPDDAAIERFYEENKARIPYPLAQVRDQIAQMLVQRGVQAKQAELVAQAKRERSFELALAKPVAPFVEIDTEGFPSKGPSDAKVTIVEFADYQCPHCKHAAAALDRIAEAYGDDVRIVLLDFPINSSGISRVVAEGGACAHRQGRFWDYHDLAFERQASLDHVSASEIAAELGLDIDAFRACMDSSFPREQVARSEAQARRLGLSATPTLFLNGRRVHIHDLETELPAEIDKILSGEKNS